MTISELQKALKRLEKEAGPDAPVQIEVFDRGYEEERLCLSVADKVRVSEDASPVIICRGA